MENKPVTGWHAVGAGIGAGIVAWIIPYIALWMFHLSRGAEDMFVGILIIAFTIIVPLAAIIFGIVGARMGMVRKKSLRATWIGAWVGAAIGIGIAVVIGMGIALWILLGGLS